MKLFYSLIFVAFLATNLFAEEIPITVVPDAEDSVGIAIANSLTEKLSASETFRNSVIDEDRVIVYFVSIDAYPAAANTECSFSCTWTVDLALDVGPVYVNQFAGYCPKGSEGQAAEMVVAEIIRDAQTFQHIMDLYKE